MRLFTVPRSGGLFRILGLLLLVGAGTAAFRAPADDDVITHLVQSVRQFYGVTLPEKTYLHLDKPWYTAGETIWLQGYVVDATRHLPDTLSKVLHVELLNGNNSVVARRNLRLQNGVAPGDIALPDSLPSGNYTLRAYTSWMRNAGPDFFYNRHLAIWPAAPVVVPDSHPAEVRSRAAVAREMAQAVGTHPDVQFFPEGGNLVAGLDNVIAFKATDYSGRGLNVSGQVLDAKNQPVVAFNSRHLGMGTFVLKPLPGQRYHAVITAAGRPLSVPMPEVHATGYTLHVVTLANEFLVAVQQQGGAGGPVVLLGHVRGQVSYLSKGQLAPNETFTARIAKSKFRTGIVHLTLFDGQGTPQAERLLFAQNEPILHVTLTPDRASYGTRQPVRVGVAVADAAGNPVATNLSLAVTDAKGALPEAETISSHLLLTSDLAGYVENPDYYFQSPTTETIQDLDALLLTQGWRRFAWKAILGSQVPQPEFGIERSLGVLGQVTQANGKPLPASKVTFLETKPQMQLLTTTSDAEGRFLFNGLGGCDTTFLTLQARNAHDGSRVLLHLDPGPPLPTRPQARLPFEAPGSQAEALLRGQEEQAAAHKFRLDTTKSILLGGVNVKGDRSAVPDPRRLYQQSSATVLKMSDLGDGAQNGTVLSAIRSRVPGVAVSGTENDPSIQIRGITSFSGSSNPLILFDGVPVSLDAIAYYPAADVETIEILKGGQATIYGSRGASGVIAVYTRRGNPNYKGKYVPAAGVAALRIPGFYCGREFYVPRYDSPKTKREFPDTRRATLYWTPSVRTGADGRAEIRFFTSDAKGAFNLKIEGISGAGLPAQGNATLQVE